MSRVTSLQLTLAIGFLCIVIAAMVIGGHKVVVFDGFVKLRPPVPSQPVTGIRRVSLGMTLDQVAKAYPEFETRNGRVYTKTDDLEIVFDLKGGVRAIAVNCSKVVGQRELASIYCGETTHELNYVYGERLKRYCDIARTYGDLYVVDDSSLAYHFSDEQIVNLIVKDPGWVPQGYKECRPKPRKIS